jgi:uncharacterized protein YjiS (DUF1127 family)
MNYNNNLLSNYKNYQRNNVPFQNNQLLRNHPNFNNVNNTNNNMHQQMQNLKQLQEMKRMQKLNDIDRLYDKAIIHKSVIKPIEIIKPDKNTITQEYNRLMQNLESELNESWKKRNNQPYKNILKKENYSRDFKHKKDLIVHTVTDADKIGLMNEFEELVQILEKHNSELKSVYSLDKKIEYKKKFEYNNRDKFRIKYDPKDYDGLKKDQIEYYKTEQQKLEKDKKKLDDIIEASLASGLLSKEDLQEIEKEENANMSADLEIDDLEAKLKKELGDEFSDLEKEAKKIINGNKTIDEVVNKLSKSEKKQETKLDNKKTEIKLDNKKIVVAKQKKDDNIDIRQKYKDRQKK